MVVYQQRLFYPILPSCLACKIAIPRHTAGVGEMGESIQLRKNNSV